jgi:8-oxo-dGTP diphosphatase
MSEAEFLAAYDPGAYPAFAVTVDIALFTLIDGKLCALLIRRGAHPYKDRWGLPGGFVRRDESIEAAASRELAEETGVARFSGHLEQLKTYGNPNRDPRTRVVSVAHVAIAPDQPDPTAGTDAAAARYWQIDELGLDRHRHGPQLAFDHHRILHDALERVRAKLEYTTVATTFLKTPFTITALRTVYEAIWGTNLDPSNFQRKVLNTPGFIKPTARIQTPGRSGGRPARLYNPGTAHDLHPALLRTNAS